MQALCHDGISTLEQADELAGRGIGMAVIKSRVDVMNGQIQVRTGPGVGTSRILSLPILHSNDVRRADGAA